MIPNCGEAPDLSGLKTAVGAKQLKKAVLNGSASRVFLAGDADPALTEPLAALCREQNIPYAWVRSMADLGRACGIEVGAAAAAVVNNPVLSDTSEEYIPAERREQKKGEN